MKLKTQWSDGATYLLFTPDELLEKLTALIPPTRAHLVRWAGAFAPASPLRKMITLNPDKKKAFQFSEDDQASKTSASLAKLLERVFKIDVTTCDKCQGKLHLVSAVKNPKEIRRYLEHVGLPGEPPEKPQPIFQKSFAYES